VDDEDVDVLVEFNDCEAELICDDPCAFVDDAEEEEEETGPGLADVVTTVVSEVAVAAPVEPANIV
jgi:hypothetical protein